MLGDVGTATTQGQTSQGCGYNWNKGAAPLRPQRQPQAAVHGDNCDTGPSPLSSPSVSKPRSGPRLILTAPQPPSPPQHPRGTMNILAPVRRDRVITDLPPVSGGGENRPRGDLIEPHDHTGVPLRVPPQCFRKEAALHTRSSFHPTVSSACQEQRTGTVG